ncbi:transketolase [Bacillus basilensis]|uniref:transketolase n=1 Tax=Bacillus basilensis TaxID=3243721 RepID=UPI003D65B0AB
MTTPNDIRKHVLKMVFKAGAAHVGTCFSVVEILHTLYFKVLKIDPETPDWKERDRFILSKGHGSAALYATLAERGFFSKTLLERFYMDDGSLPGNIDQTVVPGIDASSGSLGIGLSLGIGMSIGLKKDNINSKVYVVLGDGECQEGAVWEAIMYAGSNKLDNLVAIIDNNKLQSSNYTNDVINQNNIAERWRSFGWETFEVDGHNQEELEKVLNLPQKQPKVIIAHTLKGKGVSFMENNVAWHYGSPSQLEYVKAMRELR